MVVLDGDPAGGLTRWWRGRSAPNPVLGAWDQSLDAAGLARLAEAGVALVVIDTPSGRSTMAEQAIALADLVVLPTRPNPKDLEVAGLVVDMVEALGTPFVFLINHTQGDDDFPTAAVIALAQHGTVCPVILPQRADFGACQAQGQTVMELDPDSPSSEDMARLWDYLGAHMAKPARAAKAGRRGAAGDRRHFARQRYDQIATFSAGGMVFPCRIDDISAGGLAMVTAEAPPPGAEIALHLPYLGEFKAQSVHVAGERVGLKFLIDADEQQDLVTQLSGLLQGRRPVPAAEEAEPEAPPRAAAAG